MELKAISSWFCIVLILWLVEVSHAVLRSSWILIFIKEVLIRVFIAHLFFFFSRLMDWFFVEWWLWLITELVNTTQVHQDWIDEITCSGKKNSLPSPQCGNPFIINNSLTLGREGLATGYKDTLLGRKQRSGTLKRKEINLFGWASPFFSCLAVLLVTQQGFFCVGWWLFSCQGLFYFVKFTSIIQAPAPYRAYVPTVTYLMSKQPSKRAEVQYHDANFSSFSLAGSPPRDLQLTAYN